MMQAAAEGGPVFALAAHTAATLPNANIVAFASKQLPCLADIPNSKDRLLHA